MLCALFTCTLRYKSFKQTVFRLFKRLKQFFSKSSSPVCLSPRAGLYKDFEKSMVGNFICVYCTSFMRELVSYVTHTGIRFEFCRYGDNRFSMSCWENNNSVENLKRNAIPTLSLAKGDSPLKVFSFLSVIFCFGFAHSMWKMEKEVIVIVNRMRSGILGDRSFVRMFEKGILWYCKNAIKTVLKHTLKK